MSNTSSHHEFIAFATETPDLAVLRNFAAAHGWPEDCVMQGDVRDATDYLKSHPSPLVLLVQLPSATDAPTHLDALANVCDPETKVITIGTVNEYSFYCWLIEIGIFSYLLCPLTEPMLQSTYEKIHEPTVSGDKKGKPPGKILAIMGARGGVGATTVAINLAGLLAETSHKNVALIDLDPQDGDIALTLDIEPSRGVRDALEKPDRIDSLFIDRVMNKVGKYLFVLSAEESIVDRIHVNEQSAEALLYEARAKFDTIVIDLSRPLSPFSRQCLKHVEQIIVVTDLSLAALRDTLRLSDIIRDTFKLPAPIIVANRVGIAPKYEVPIADFESGINTKFAHTIPFAPDLYMYVGNDIPVVKQKSHAATKPFYDLAATFLPELKNKTAQPPKKGFALFKKT